MRVHVPVAATAAEIGLVKNHRGRPTCPRKLTFRLRAPSDVAVARAGSSEDIFDFIENSSDAGQKFLVRVSFLQIYNESISDLLDPESLKKKDRHHMKVREDGSGGTYVDGLSEHIVKSPSEIMELMRLGATMRTTVRLGRWSHVAAHYARPPAPCMPGYRFHARLDLACPAAASMPGCPLPTRLPLACPPRLAWRPPEICGARSRCLAAIASASLVQAPTPVSFSPAARICAPRGNGATCVGRRRRRQR